MDYRSDQQPLSSLILILPGIVVSLVAYWGLKYYLEWIRDEMVKKTILNSASELWTFNMAATGDTGDVTPAELCNGFKLNGLTSSSTQHTLQTGLVS